MNEEVRHFSLRKLSVGLASVLVGVSIFGASRTVKADTVANNQTSSVTNNAQSSDTQENENAVKSTFSSDNQVDNAKNNLIQTQVEGKKDQNASSDLTENKNQTSSVSETQKANDSKDLDAENDIVRTSLLQKTNNQSNPIAEKTVQNDVQTNNQTAQSFYLQKNSQAVDVNEIAESKVENDTTNPVKKVMLN